MCVVVSISRQRCTWALAGRSSASALGVCMGKPACAIVCLFSRALESFVEKLRRYCFIGMSHVSCTSRFASYLAVYLFAQHTPIFLDMYLFTFIAVERFLNGVALICGVRNNIRYTCRTADTARPLDYTPAQVARIPSLVKDPRVSRPTSKTNSGAISVQFFAEKKRFATNCSTGPLTRFDQNA